MDFSQLVATKITELMKERNLNVNQLSKLTGIYRSTLNMFLKRKNKTIRLENLLYICEAFNIKLSDFFSDERFDECEAHDWRNKVKN
ncbi:MAG: helix-turn-helix transcriptional regulator [Clostridia bacterium]|jgi:DNA-binding Xre family transcriptional regulator|nr:helix-turn-helix transcriptional regulator [Clostridia bacterium]